MSSSNYLGPSNKVKFVSQPFRPINYLGPNILVTESGFRVVL